MKTKKMSEKSIVQEVKKGFEKNFAVKTEKKKVRENPLSLEKRVLVRTLK